MSRKRTFGFCLGLVLLVSSVAPADIVETFDTLITWDSTFLEGYITNGTAQTAISQYQTTWPAGGSIQNVMKIVQTNGKGSLVKQYPVANGVSGNISCFLKISRFAGTDKGLRFLYKFGAATASDLNSNNGGGNGWTLLYAISTSNGGTSFNVASSTSTSNTISIGWYVKSDAFTDGFQGLFDNFTIASPLLVEDFHLY